MEARSFIVQLPVDVDAPSVRAALDGPIANLVIASWRELAQADGHVDNGDYLAQLTRQSALRYPYLDNPDLLAIVNTHFAADWMEYGRGGFHLPARWGARGGKWKVGKDGRRYAHVPFWHTTPNSKGGGSTTSRRRTVMPSAVYSQAKKGLRNVGDRLTGFGGQYKQSKSYEYYRRAGLGVGSDLADNTPNALGYTWKSSPFEGMFVGVRQSTPAAARHSKYLTIRTITEDSPGWYIPPTPAHHYAERAVDQVSSEIFSILDRAAAHDLEQLMVDITRGIFT